MDVKRRCLVVLATVILVVVMLDIPAAPGVSSEIPALTLTHKAAFTIGNRTVTVNGQTYQMDAAPYIDSNGRTMVPARYLGEVLGCTVTWDEDTRTAHFFLLNRADFYLAVGNPTTTGISTPIKMDTVPVVKGPSWRLFVPIRWVIKLFPYEDITWDAPTGTVILTPGNGDTERVYAPGIYLYPLQRKVLRIQLGNEVNMTAASPVYPPGGWQVTAFPDGRIMTNGVGYGHLWYEAVVPANWQSRSGWLVTGGTNSCPGPKTPFLPLA